MWVRPKGAKASLTALEKAETPPTFGLSPTPLAPIGWCGEGVTVKSVSQMRRLDRGRQEEVHEAAARDIADLVIGDLLAHGDRQRLGQAAVHLALDHHRVDAGAAVVERIEAADLGHAGVDVDIDDADIGAERIGHVGRVVVAHRLEPGLEAGDRLVVGGKGDLRHGLEALGIALDLEAVDVPFEVVVVHFEEIGGDHLRLGPDLAPGHGGGGAGDRRRARAVGAEAIGRGVGVALLDGDLVGRDADLGGEDLGEGRGVALALADRADAGRWRCPVGWMRISQESNMPRPRMSQFFIGPAPTISVKKATPMPISLRVSPRVKASRVGRLLGAERLVVDGGERLVHRGVIVAASRIPSRAPSGRGTAPCG